MRGAMRRVRTRVGRDLELKDTDTNLVSYLTIIIILNSLSLVPGRVLQINALFTLCFQVISMAEQLSTSKCDSPLLQAFVENRSILLKIAARITGCRSRAEDVVQDAFFRLGSAPQITSSFKAQLSYLFQIVRNLAIDHYRKQAMELKYSGSEEEGLNVVLQNASPEATHINLAALDDIARALNDLPPRTRYAFEMYRLHGVPQKDIAKELGVSPTLVNFMIRDAMVHCRKMTR
ncbi:RNA polymerase sigma-70 factor (ECF subfamily) [Pseudomonas sp. URMO17WK12:I10]|jgi:RNA polymerase sigma factor (sigma-70 family)|nr:RNA polymerase sigma-70 factor (ECF subfamily) [Pseudomonas sp. LAMO17WK12:I3]RED13719.1 RNA polymerase sigma-70 factor (ECF subfamily) [Pseudomonas sp. URMO17WK12:I10]TFA89186.1 RNA polymerase sigma-70 factor (ECF subfamily) [Pseudomonas sp. URIL14HWK12:I1]CRN07603.1 putative RNA polymerase sigma factor FecI [Pseudomonas sp. URMO17WK12:I11]SNB73423.1 RNA polymerase sigma-70 factor, ECF subfamily [Pseudomonas sp. LAIL14HWK12:I4]SOD06070.1 RNA polymerase sigma-70 factor, ECF subfamily [Pseud